MTRVTKMETIAAVILTRCGRDGAGSRFGRVPGRRLQANDLAHDPEERAQDG